MADPVRDFKLDEDGDLAVESGDLALVAGADAVPQGAAVRVRTFLGEIMLDNLQGVDYLGQVLVKNPDPLVVRELVREAIADTPDVTDVQGAAVRSLPNREASVDYKVATIYGGPSVVGRVQVP